jgi:hypothetical protein
MLYYLGFRPRYSIRKAMAPMLILVSWEVWKEINARVSRNHASPTTTIIIKIEDEATLWI